MRSKSLRSVDASEMGRRFCTLSGLFPGFGIGHTIEWRHSVGSYPVYHTVFNSSSSCVRPSSSRFRSIFHVTPSLPGALRTFTASNAKYSCCSVNRASCSGSYTLGFGGVGGCGKKVSAASFSNSSTLRHVASLMFLVVFGSFVLLTMTQYVRHILWLPVFSSKDAQC